MLKRQRVDCQLCRQHEQEQTSSKLHAVPQRAFQDMFDTRRIADAAGQINVNAEIADDEKTFIESRSMFFLATVDARGAPACSCKRGDPGFVRIVDKSTIAFLGQDGNGMFYLMGHIRAYGKIGMLLIDFEAPHRIRLQGTASIDENDPLIMRYNGADLVVRVHVEELFINCPRYVHRYDKVKPSRYVPRRLQYPLCRLETHRRDAARAGHARSGQVRGRLRTYQDGRVFRAGADRTRVRSPHHPPPHPVLLPLP